MTELATAESKPKLFRSLTAVKHILYLVLALLCFLLFIISCVVVPYERDTYGGYNPPAAELAFIGGFGALFVPLFVWTQRVRPDWYTNTMVADLALCMFMWLFLLGGVGGLTAQTYDLLSCQELFICRGFSTMMGLAWIGWIITTVMLGYICVVLASLWSQGQNIEWMKSLKEAVQVDKAQNSGQSDAAKEVVV